MFYTKAFIFYILYLKKIGIKNDYELYQLYFFAYRTIKYNYYTVQHTFPLVKKSKRF